MPEYIYRHEMTISFTSKSGDLADYSEAVRETIEKQHDYVKGSFELEDHNADSQRVS